MVFFCSSISVVLLDKLGIFECHNSLFLSSPHLRFIIGLIRDLFVSYVDAGQRSTVGRAPEIYYLAVYYASCYVL